MSSKNRDSAAAAKRAARRAPQHRRDAGRHREPPRTASELVAPATASVKLATIGVIGTAAVIMAPVAASAAAGGPGSTPAVNGPTSGPALVQPILDASAATPGGTGPGSAVVLPAAAIAAPASAPPAIVAPAPAPPPAMPSAPPVQLYNNLVPVPPTMMQAIQQYLSSLSGSVRVAGFTPVGAGGMVQVFDGPNGGGLAVGVGVGLPGASVKVTAGDQAPTQASLGFQTTATFQTPTTYRDTVSVGTDTNLLNAAGSQDFGKTTLKGSYTFPGGFISPQAGVSVVVGPDTAGPGPNDMTGNGTVGGRVRVGSSELSGLLVVKMTTADFNQAMAAMAAADGGPPMSTWYPDPTPQDRINQVFGQLAQTQGVQVGGVDGLPAQSPVPYLEIGGIQNPSGSIPGIAPGVPGETINPVTGLPDSASGTQGSALLPGQFAQPAPAVSQFQFPATDALGNPTGYYYTDPMIAAPAPGQPSADQSPAPVPQAAQPAAVPVVPADQSAPAAPATVPVVPADQSAPAVPVVPADQSAPAAPAAAPAAPAAPGPPAPDPSSALVPAAPVYNPAINAGTSSFSSTGLGTGVDPLSGLHTGIATTPATGLTPGLPTDTSIPSVAPVDNPSVSLGSTSFSSTDLGTSTDPLGAPAVAGVSGGIGGGAFGGSAGS